MLGDNVFEYSIAPYVSELPPSSRKGARVLLKEVGDPERYGVAAMDERQVIDIEEKPAAAEVLLRGGRPVHVRLTGVGTSCAMPSRLSERGELEITSVNNAYIERAQLEYDFCEGRWTDAGTFPSLADAQQILGANENRILGHG